MTAKLKDAALRVVVLSTLLDRVKTAWTQARADQAALMGEVGADGVNVELPDGTRVAKVALVDGRVSAQVADEDDFTAWVADRYPDQVQTVTTVKAAFRQRLLTDAADRGQPVDAETGEVIPGIGIRKGAPYVSTSSLQRDVIVEAWRHRQINPLDYVDVPAIEGA